MHTTPPSGQQWSIGADGHTAVVVEVGGGLREYSAHGQSITDGYGEDELCPSSAGQVLAPWPNRIRDGQYDFHGERHQLPLTEPARHNAIHGLVNWARWRAVAHEPDAVTVAYELPGQPGYPWPLALRTRWSVGANGLRADHEVTNLGTSPAPFGMGSHAYLWMPGTPVDELALRLPVQCRLLVDGRLLPIGAAKTNGGPFDYTTTRRIGAAVLDTAFGRVADSDEERPAADGSGGNEASLMHEASGRRIDVWADASFGWWQVFTGDALAGDRHRRSVAIEPMTCPPDAFRSGRDLIELAPGATWTGTWGIRPGGFGPTGTAS
jgi:aldose 1-epimerase